MHMNTMKNGICMMLKYSSKKAFWMVIQRAFLIYNEVNNFNQKIFCKTRASKAVKLLKNMEKIN